jgi:hypothetical protein
MLEDRALFSDRADPVWERTLRRIDWPKALALIGAVVIPWLIIAAIVLTVTRM